MVPIPVAERGTEKGLDFACGAALACGFVYLFSLLATYLFVLNEQGGGGPCVLRSVLGHYVYGTFAVFYGAFVVGIGAENKKRRTSRGSMCIGGDLTLSVRLSTLAEHADFCAGKCGRNPTFSYGIPGYGTAGEET